MSSFPNDIFCFLKKTFYELKNNFFFLDEIDLRCFYCNRGYFIKLYLYKLYIQNVLKKYFINIFDKDDFMHI